MFCSLNNFPIKNQYIINLFLTFFFAFLITILIYYKIIYPTIIPVVQDSTIIIFRDWQIIVISNICDGKGFDVFIENPCDFWNSKHVYGEILLKLPFVQKNLFFYFIIFPILINFIFLYLITSFFIMGQKINNFFYLFFFIFSTPVILAIERANIDIIIFLLVFLLAKYKNILFNYFVIILSTMIKFFPIVLITIFLFKDNFKKFLINVIFSFFIIIFLLYSQKDSLIKIFYNKSQFSGSGIYEFSILGFLNSINESNYFYFILIFIFLAILLFYFKFSFSINENNIIYTILNKDKFENRLFIISSSIILTCYFTFSNFFYREIFLLGLIPYLITNFNGYHKYQNIKFLFYLLFCKFLLSTILIFFVRNKIILDYQNHLILTKHSLDLFLMIIISFIFILNLIFYLKAKL